MKKAKCPTTIKKKHTGTSSSKMPDDERSSRRESSLINELKNVEQFPCPKEKLADNTNLLTPKNVLPQKLSSKEIESSILEFSQDCKVQLKNVGTNVLNNRRTSLNLNCKPVNSYDLAEFAKPKPKIDVTKKNSVAKKYTHTNLLTPKNVLPQKLSSREIESSILEFSQDWKIKFFGKNVLNNRRTSLNFNCKPVNSDDLAVFAKPKPKIDVTNKNSVAKKYTHSVNELKNVKQFPCPKEKLADHTNLLTPKNVLPQKLSSKEVESSILKFSQDGKVQLKNFGSNVLNNRRTSLNFNCKPVNCDNLAVFAKPKPKLDVTNKNSVAKKYTYTVNNVQYTVDENIYDCVEFKEFAEKMKKFVIFEENELHEKLLEENISNIWLMRYLNILKQKESNPKIPKRRLSQRIMYRRFSTLFQNETDVEKITEKKQKPEKLKNVPQNIKKLPQNVMKRRLTVDAKISEEIKRDAEEKKAQKQKSEKLKHVQSIEKLPSVEKISTRRFSQRIIKRRMTMLSKIE